MEGNLDAVVALADRLARRSESRLTGDDDDEVGQGLDEEEVEDRDDEELEGNSKGLIVGFANIDGSCI